MNEKDKNCAVLLTDAQEIKVIRCEPDTDTFDAARKAIGCEWIEIVEPESLAKDNLILLIDEEGKLKGFRDAPDSMSSDLHYIPGELLCLIASQQIKRFSVCFDDDRSADDHIAMLLRSIKVAGNTIDEAVSLQFAFFIDQKDEVLLRQRFRLNDLDPLTANRLSCGIESVCVRFATDHFDLLRVR